MTEAAQVMEQITAFLAAIGLPVEVVDDLGPTLLPGVVCRAGRLLVRPDRLDHPGDLLHEAGHLAVVGPERREGMDGDAGGDGGDEMAAIAWSYAAALHLGLDPAVVFHADGYRGGSGALLENFAAGRYLAVPLLEWLGLTAGPERAAEVGVEPYPVMQRWVVEPDWPS